MFLVFDTSVRYGRASFLARPNGSAGRDVALLYCINSTRLCSALMERRDRIRISLLL